MEINGFTRNVCLQFREAAVELIETACPSKGDIFVVGCSSSEVLGNKIGTGGSEFLAAEMFKVLKKVTDERDLYLAVQCCEHLNRALVVERSVMKTYGLDEVTVRPVAKAGGAMAAAAYENFTAPAVVEKLTAHLGLDIGQTLIGMHLKKVVVPVRLKHKVIGEAVLTAARTRPPLIGGERAVYSEKIR